MFRSTKNYLALETFYSLLLTIIIFNNKFEKIRCGFIKNTTILTDMDISLKGNDFYLILNQFNQTDVTNPYAIYGFNYIGFNNSDAVSINESDQSLHYWALILLFCPLSTIFGNILVVVSVIKEKSLRTVTNYFVVSLALADLTVATAVMPFAVYYEVNFQI